MITNIYIIIHPIKTVSAIGISEAVSGEGSAVYCSIIAISTLVIGIAVEGVVGYEARFLVVEVIDFGGGQSAGINADVVYFTIPILCKFSLFPDFERAIGKIVI